MIEAPTPELNGDPGQVLLAPSLGCLCGSDIPFFNGDDPRFDPGPAHSLHEMIGTIVASTSDRYNEGDRILYKPDQQDGLCQRIVVPEEEAVPLLPGLADEQSVLSQPLGTVVCALRKLPNLLNVRAAVVGLGPIGQLFCSTLGSMGASRIIGVDPLAYRREAALKMGATEVIDSAADPVDAVTGLMDGACDLVVEAVGHHEFALNLAIELCRHKGSVLQFGIPPVHSGDIEFEQLYRKNITLYTSCFPDPLTDYPLAMRWIRDGDIDIDPLVTHRFGLEDVQPAFEHYRDRRDGALKVFIQFPADG